MGTAYYDTLYCLILDMEEGGWINDLTFEVEEYAAFGFLYGFEVADFEDWRYDADKYFLFDGE